MPRLPMRPNALMHPSTHAPMQMSKAAKKTLTVIQERVDEGKALLKDGVDKV